MKRILILNYEFPPLGGGGGVAAYQLAKGFIQNGYAVDYITTWYKGLKKSEIIDGINVYRVKVIGRKELATATMISLLSYPVAALWLSMKFCLKNRYEFINTQFVVPTGPLGFILSKLFGIPNLVSLHGGDIYDPTKTSSPHHRWYLRFAIRLLLNSADRVVAQSSNTQENAIKYYHPSKRIEIIPLPYEPFVFRPTTRGELGLEEGKKYIIGVGRLVKRKGFDTFIRALAMLDTNVEGIIIGEGPERQALEALAAKLGVARRLHLVGYVNTEKKFQYLSNADVFVLSSVHEGFGIVLLEAMQVGLPVVASNNGGQIDLFDQTEASHCQFFEAGDEFLLKEKIQLLMSFYSSRDSTKKNPENLELYTPAAISRKYLSLVVRRVLMISTVPDPSSGLTKYSTELANNFKQFEVDYYTLFFEKYPLRDLLKPLFLTFKGADIYHVQYTPTVVGPLFPIFMLASRILNRATILTLHEKPDFYIGKFKNRFLAAIFLKYEKLNYYLANKIIVHNESHKILLITRFSLDNNKIKVIPHPIFTQPLPREVDSAENDSFNLTIFGRIVAKKNYEACFRLLSMLPEKFTISIVGEAVDQAYIRKLRVLISDLKLDSRVRFLGFLPEEEVALLMARTRYCLFLYNSVTQSGALNTALGYGIPVVCSALPEFQEIFSRYKIGIISDDLAFIANQIQAVSLDTYHQSLHQINSELGIKQIAMETEEIYQDVVR